MRRYYMISKYFKFKSYVDATIFNLDEIGTATVFTEGNEADDQLYQSVISSFALGDLGPFEKEYIN